MGQQGVGSCVWRLIPRFLDLFLAQDLAMRAVSADLCPGEQNLKAEVRLNLSPQTLQWIAKKLLDLSAAKTDHVRMFLLGLRLVVVLIPTIVHQIQLVHQAAFFEELQSAIDRHPVEFRILLFGHLIEIFSVQMLAGFIDQFEQYLPLPRESNAFE